MALAILGGADAPELPRWQADIDTAKYMFRNTYASHALAQRCSEILELIVPHNLGPVPDWTDLQDDPGLPALMDFSAWPNDSGDFLTLFGWPESGAVADFGAGA
jgi:transcriptional regulatory protein GAL4